MTPKRSKREPHHTGSSGLDAAVRKVFSRYGRKGGAARAESLTAEQRSALAKRAALARWRAAREAREAEWSRFSATNASKKGKRKGK